MNFTATVWKIDLFSSHALSLFLFLFFIIFYFFDLLAKYVQIPTHLLVDHNDISVTWTCDIWLTVLMVILSSKVTLINPSSAAFNK